MSRVTPCGVCGAETEELPAGMSLGAEPMWMRVQHKAPCGLDCGGGQHGRKSHGPYTCSRCGWIDPHDADALRRSQRWI